MSLKAFAGSKPLACIIAFIAATAPGCDLDFYGTSTVTFEAEPIEIVADGRDKANPAWSPDGSKIAYTVVTRLSSFRNYDIATGAVTEPQYFEVLPNRLQDSRNFDLSPEKQRIVFFEAGKVYILKKDNGTVEAFDLNLRFARFPSWSSDGKRIAFWGQPDNGAKTGIWVLSVSDGSSNLALPSTGAFELSWSPDSKMLAFEQNNQIWTLDVDTGDTTRLTQDSESGCYDPHWSPEGSSIAYLSQNGDSLNIWNHDVETGGKSLIGKNTFVWGSFVRWSPDGAKLALVARRYIEQGPRTFILSKDGKVLYQTNINRDPFWVNEHELFLADESRFTEIEVFSLIDSSVTRITQRQQSQLNFSPAWYPDNDRLIYVAFDAAARRSFILAEASMNGPAGFKTVLEPNYSFDNPAVSPDGRYILFDSAGGLRLLRTGDDKVINITEYAQSFLREPAWNAQSNGVVCTDSRRNLVITTTDTNLTLQRTMIPGSFRNPSWYHPKDGETSYIAAESRGSILLMTPDGRMQDLAIIAGLEPTWSPDGRQLAYTSNGRLFITTVRLESP